MSLLRKASLSTSVAVLAAATFRTPRRAAMSGLVEGMLAEFWGSLQEGRHKCWVLASGTEIASKLITLTTEICLHWAIEGMILTTPAPPRAPLDVSDSPAGLTALGKDLTHWRQLRPQSSHSCESKALTNAVHHNNDIPRRKEGIKLVVGSNMHNRKFNQFGGIRAC